jgi:pimeloyl-ACP methyl ester carboxylesterase
MRIVYIHGASATQESFNYIRQHVVHSDEAVEYDSANGFSNNLKQIVTQLSEHDDRMFFVAHSLGGIYALYLLQEFRARVAGAVTISTPYGGAESADYTKYFLPFSRLLQDIGPKSLPIRASRDIIIDRPWTNIVTTRGNTPWILSDNDGVVTVNSQSCRKDMELIRLNINHYEVVLNQDAINIIKDKIREVK